ncbi:MAG: hydrogenase formation protein HypD [Acetobacteraceae bacterium]|nr:hydrogenase formation protein HypD [Acetobacteraceae bacterium]
MKFAHEYRDKSLAWAVAETIGRRVDPARDYTLMEVCGGHTHAICRYGMIDLLPENVRLVHGPGCPVCVLPIGRIDQAIAMATQPHVTLATFGDMMRVPGSDHKTLQGTKSAGADIRIVYSVLDALEVARKNPDRQVIFFAIGFETTAPATALALQMAARERLGNFFVFCTHVSTPSAIDGIFATNAARSGQMRIDGIIGPGHVAAITGSDYYQDVAARHRLPMVISGFEPLDLLQSILMLIDQINDGRAEVETQYARAVTTGGNARAQAMMRDVFVARDSFDWRGLGELPASALRLAPAYERYDAELIFGIDYRRVADNPACSCIDILCGVKQPLDCRLFGKVCTPETPVGACMVSPEGTCSAYWQHARHRAGETA